MKKIAKVLGSKLQKKSYSRYEEYTVTLTSSDFKLIVNFLTERIYVYIYCMDRCIGTLNFDQVTSYFLIPKEKKVIFEGVNQNSVNYVEITDKARINIFTGLDKEKYHPTWNSKKRR